MLRTVLKDFFSHSEITAMLFCTQLDCLITGFQDYAITVWGLDWVPRVTFFGHDGNFKIKLLQVQYLFI